MAFQNVAKKYTSYLFHSLAALAVMVVGTSAQANALGADVQSFNTTTSGLDFITVESSETLRPCYLNCGVYISYANDTLPKLKKTILGDRDGGLAYSDVNFGLGLTSWWDTGVSFTNVHHQGEVSDISYKNTGLTDIRINTKMRFLGNYSGGVAAVLSANFNLIKNNPFAGNRAQPIYNVELVADTTLRNRVALAVNLGYRFRSESDPIKGAAIQPLGNQVIASGAVSYLFPQWDTKIIGEIFSSFTQETDLDKSPFKEDELDSVEVLLGIKHDFNNRVAGHIGATFDVLDQDNLGKDWRVYAGLNINFGPYGPKSWCPEQDQPIVRVDKGESIADALTKDKADPFLTDPQYDREILVSKDVLFDFNSDRIKGDSQPLINRLGEYLVKGNFVRITIEGHTDSIGPAAYNVDLSLRRARSVKNALRKAGVPSGKILTRGYGESRPVSDNGNYQGRSLNRRVEFRVQWK